MKFVIAGAGAIGAYIGARMAQKGQEVVLFARGPHFRAIYDDKGRMMVLECANNDIADSWEREGENEEYFHRFSEKQGYPLGINIIFYAMTH